MRLKSELRCEQCVSAAGFSMWLEIRMKIKKHYLLSYLAETKKPWNKSTRNAVKVSFSPVLEFMFLSTCWKCPCEFRKTRFLRSLSLSWNLCSDAACLQGPVCSTAFPFAMLPLCLHIMDTSRSLYGLVESSETNFYSTRIFPWLYVNIVQGIRCVF